MQQIKRVNYEKAVSPVIATILMVAITVVLSGVLYVWAANLAESNTDGTFEMYTFSAASAPGELTSDSNDNLVIVTMDQGQDINWAKLSIKLSVAGAASVSCAGPGETTGACIVLESEPDGGVWEIGEAVTIKENGVDLCDGETCEVSVKIINQREGITLDDSSTTAESTQLPPNPCYSKVLYNTQTHEVITKSTLDEGGHSTWMLLSESSPNYVHPAYYHKSMHQVLDCSEGSMVGSWILTEMQSGGSGSDSDSGNSDSSDSGDGSSDEPAADPNCGDDYVLYNYQTHASYNQQDVTTNNAGDWMLLDEDEFPEYNHPAYYDRGVHQVLDCTEGDSVGAWSLVDPNSGGSHGGSSSDGGGDSGSGDSGSENTETVCDDGIDNDNDGDVDGDDSDCTPPANPDCDDSYVLYNYQTHASYNQQDVIDGNADDWMLLDENDETYADYNHPAYYSQSNGHQVLDCTQDDTVGAWSLEDPNSGSSHSK